MSDLPAELVEQAERLGLRLGPSPVEVEHRDATTQPDPRPASLGPGVEMTGYATGTKSAPPQPDPKREWPCMSRSMGVEGPASPPEDNEYERGFLDGIRQATEAPPRGKGGRPRRPCNHAPIWLRQYTHKGYSYFSCRKCKTEYENERYRRSKETT